MKRLLTSIAIATVGIMALPQIWGENAPMDEINQHVQALLAANSKAESAVEESDLRASTDFTQLKALCQSNWASVLEHLASVTGGDEGKSLVISAFEGLDASAYMTALETLAGKFREGQLPESVMISALISTGRMQAFLADNYEHSRVQTLLNDLKPRFGADNPVKANIADILSGKTKADIDDFRDAHQGSGEGNIPKILLPP